MVKQHEISAPPGARKKHRRVGRGDGSGRGSYSGRGRKGQGARSGNGKQNPGFEGNQLSLVQRLPTIGGFTNIFRRDFAVVNLRDLERTAQAGQVVTPEWLRQAGLVRDLKLPVKVLGDGDLTKRLQVSAHRFSKASREKLESAGGSVTELPLSKGTA